MHAYSELKPSLFNSPAASHTPDMLSEADTNPVELTWHENPGEALLSMTER